MSSRDAEDLQLDMRFAVVGKRGGIRRGQGKGRSAVQVRKAFKANVEGRQMMVHGLPIRVTTRAARPKSVNVEVIR